MYLLLDDFKVNARQIELDAETLDGSLAGRLREALKISSALNYHILGKSIDSRRGAPEVVYRLLLEMPVETFRQADLHGYRTETVSETDFQSLTAPPELNFPEHVSLKNPLVVGTGPAGLLAGYYLALAGCAPILLDRGFDVAKRAQDCEDFFRTRVLNEESNLLFGAGGAGTFSDGKLYTRVHDPRADFVLHTLVQAGAPADTLYLKRPHLGSDLLRKIVPNMLDAIRSAGGTVRFGAQVRNVLIGSNRCQGVELASGEKLFAPMTLLAYGLGGRDLSLNLLKNVRHELKGFQLGCRVEHLQSFVDRHQYRCFPRPTCLGAAEYNMISRSRSEAAGTGVTTFCMCPGGEIVPATAWRGQLSSNGMSLHARDGKFANAAVITTLGSERFSSVPEAYEFLEQLEKTCFLAGGADYSFPGQTIASWVRGETVPVAGGTSARLGTHTASLRDLLPTGIGRKFADAFLHFEQLMKGFLQGNAIGIESCVSSPVRFVRDPLTLCSSLPGLYFAGEGAGYAGGIVSAAIDGLKAAEQMVKCEI